MSIVNDLHTVIFPYCSFSFATVSSSFHPLHFCSASCFAIPILLLSLHGVFLAEWSTAVAFPFGSVFSYTKAGLTVFILCFVSVFPLPVTCREVSSVFSFVVALVIRLVIQAEGIVLANGKVKCYSDSDRTPNGLPHDDLPSTQNYLISSRLIFGSSFRGTTKLFYLVDST